MPLPSILAVRGGTDDGIGARDPTRHEESAATHAAQGAGIVDDVGLAASAARGGAGPDPGRLAGAVDRDHPRFPFRGSPRVDPDGSGADPGSIAALARRLRRCRSLWPLPLPRVEFRADRGAGHRRRLARRSVRLRRCRGRRSLDRHPGRPRPELGNTLMAAIFSLDDERAYDRFVPSRCAAATATCRRATPPVSFSWRSTASPSRCCVDAMARGYMPTLKRWLDSGSHKLVHWDPDLSVADLRQPGRHSARLERGHPRLPLVGQAAPGADRLLQDADGARAGDWPYPPAMASWRSGGAGRWNALLRQRRRKYRRLQCLRR